MTLGGAKALSIDNHIGNFVPGKEADFVVIDSGAIDVLSHRIELSNSIEEEIFALIVLGDDRCTQATYVMGEAAYQRS